MQRLKKLMVNCMRVPSSPNVLCRMQTFRIKCKYTENYFILETLQKTRTMITLVYTKQYLHYVLYTTYTLPYIMLVDDIKFTPV